MWFKKKKVVNSGITLREWIKNHMEDKKYLKIYIGKDGTYKKFDSFYSSLDISYGIAEKYSNNSVSAINLVDRDNRHEATIVLIEE